MTPLTERNRENAKFSTGPKTSEGKQHSSQNATVHGLYSQSALLPSENADLYRAHVSAYMVDLAPQGPLQTDLAEIVADNMWRLRRIRKLEAEHSEALSTSEYNLNESLRPELIQQTVNLTRSLEMLGRHEVRIQNAMHKAMKELKALQTQQSHQPPVPPATKTKSGFVPAIEFSALQSDTEAAVATAQSIHPVATKTMLTRSFYQEKMAA